MIISVRKILATLSIFVSMFVLSSCHKYPEDPFISFRRPWKRLEGTWQFTSYKINGTEHYHDFDAFLGPKTLLDCSITFTPFYNLKGWYVIKDDNGRSLWPDQSLTIYKFDDNRKYTYFLISADTSNFYSQLWKGNRSGYAATVSSWKILELYSKHLHINSNNIDIYFKKND